MGLKRLVGCRRLSSDLSRKEGEETSEKKVSLLRREFALCSGFGDPCRLTFVNFPGFLELPKKSCSAVTFLIFGFCIYMDALSFFKEKNASQAINLPILWTETIIFADLSETIHARGKLGKCTRPSIPPQLFDSNLLMLRIHHQEICKRKNTLMCILLPFKPGRNSLPGYMKRM